MRITQAPGVPDDLTARAARGIRAMVCVNVAATGEGAPMADTYDVILRLVQNVQKDEA